MPGELRIAFKIVIQALRELNDPDPIIAGRAVYFVQNSALYGMVQDVLAWLPDPDEAIARVQGTYQMVLL